MTYGSVNHRQTLLRARESETHSDCNCGDTCRDCSEEASTVAGLAAYTASRRRLLVKSLGANTFEYKRIKPGTPEANTECIRLHGVWEAVKRNIRKANNELSAVARQMEQARRGFGGQMDKDISYALVKLTGDALGALATALSGKPVHAIGELILAGQAFEQWRHRFNRHLPARISRFLVGWKARYDNAVSKLQHWVDGEKRVTREMSRLRCANFR